MEVVVVKCAAEKDWSWWRLLWKLWKSSSAAQLNGSALHCARGGTVKKGREGAICGKSVFSRCALNRRPRPSAALGKWMFRCSAHFRLASSMHTYSTIHLTCTHTLLKRCLYSPKWRGPYTYCTWCPIQTPLTLQFIVPQSTSHKSYIWMYFQ